MLKSIMVAAGLTVLAAGALAQEGGGVPEFKPEEQVATGRFLTALEVKPILGATKANWVGLREYGGQDLLYFTHLLAWRCGLHQIRFAVNDGPEEVFRAEPCYADTAQPNAISTDAPYLVFPPGSVLNVRIRLVLDDGTEDTAEFQRTAILIP